MKLKEKVALVTGAARGIGAAIAERLAADGAAVAINYARSANAAESVAKRIRDAGGKAIVVQADVGDWSQAQALVEKAGRAFGRLDILVNNAADIRFEPLATIGVEEMRTQFAVNFEAAVATMQAALAFFPEEGGRIINISSLAVANPIAGHMTYNASKSALEAMTQVAAVELGARGITANVVRPGLTETDAVKASLNDEGKAFLIGRTPLRRVGTPFDIADVVAFLASSDARWITGQTLMATGGLTP
ncbi:SDR family NAD(P)-dependent oxidoreductase [Sphingobium sp. EM0848]|uniref:SDR family NAD(P)-dependent oxidoreductase n=1 Tax=Sphingobium sp. EM0848 TaxID=2743473 RepID=UPI00159C5C1B|nr:SDR family oxidoreductase [Sphingobium sp. EM0848]